MTSVAIVTVNFRTGRLVGKSLEAVERERRRFGGEICIYVVDNNSGDDSVSFLSGLIEKKGWGDWVYLRPHPTNAGFAAGNNVALREILSAPDAPDYIYFLNPDAQIKSGAITTMTDFLGKTEGVAIVGTRLEEPDGSPNRAAFRFPTAISEFLRGAQVGALDRLLNRWVVAPAPRTVPHRTEWVSGASFMVRRRVFEKIGLLDEGYFLYFEEVDFMKKAAAHGLEVWYHPDARVIHDAGSATQIKDMRAKSGALPLYWYNSLRRYFLKHHGRAGTLVAIACWFAGRVVFSVAGLVRGRKYESGGTSPRLLITRVALPVLRGL